VIDSCEDGNKPASSCLTEQLLVFQERLLHWSWLLCQFL